MKIWRAVAEMLRGGIALLAILLASTALAQPAVTLPLEGYYRPGRYMPVRVTGTGAIHLSADGAMTTQVGNADQPVDAIVPWLAWERVSGGAANGMALGELRPLTAQQALVAYTTATAGAGHPTIEGQVVPVRVDPRALLTSAPAAWQGVDVLLLDAPTWGQVEPERALAWLANGTTIAVESEARPDGQLPWERQASLWAARIELVGPAQVMVLPGGYAPTAAWAPGWEAPMRYAMLLAGVLFALLLILSTLPRRRGTAWVALGVCAAAGAGFGWWRAATPATFAVSGAVRVDRGALAQVDRWRYLASRADATISAAFDELTLPVGYAPGHLREMGLTLYCDADGRPGAISCPLAANHRMAFLERRVLPRSSPATWGDVPTPMRALARTLYLGSGVRLLGTGDGTGPWADVVLGAGD